MESWTQEIHTPQYEGSRGAMNDGADGARELLLSLSLPNSSSQNSTTASSSRETFEAICSAGKDILNLDLSIALSGT